MAKATTVLGLMSGTSMDGIDLALLNTDGESVARRLASGFVPYPEALKAHLRTCLGLSTDPDGRVARAEQLVTDAHIAAVQGFIKTHPDAQIEMIGFHGQTIFHDPANARTWQLGDGKRLAAVTGIDTVYDFRSKDMNNGGQGAPFLPLYHKALVQLAKLDMPVCVLNIGGVSNITWIDGERIIACDTGPGSALIDDWMLKKAGMPMDKGGATALKGQVDSRRVWQWLKHPYFALPAPKSLDRNAFADCSVDDMSLEDGAATLTAFTVATIMVALRLMPSMPKILIAVGGGRHNQTIMRGLGADVTLVDSTTLGWSGDSIEAEGFAYLAMRARLGLPLSLPSTTGCKNPTLGGIYVRAPRRT